MSEYKHSKQVTCSWRTKDDTDSNGDMLHWTLQKSLLSQLAPQTPSILAPSSFRYPIHIFLSSITPNSLWTFADDYICSYNSQTFQIGIVRVQTIGDRQSVDGISGSVGHPLLCDNAGAQWNRWLATLQRNSSLL